MLFCTACFFALFDGILRTTNGFEKKISMLWNAEIDQIKQKPTKKKQQHQKQQQWQHQLTRKQQRQICIHVDIVRSKRHLYFALIYLGSARVGFLFMCWLFSQRVLLISEVLRWHSSVFCVWFGHTDRASERQRSREIKRESEQTTRDRLSSFAYTYIFYSFSHSGFGILFWICKNECWIIDKVVYSTLCMCAVCLVISLD